MWRELPWVRIPPLPKLERVDPGRNPLDLRSCGSGEAFRYRDSVTERQQALPRVGAVSRLMRSGLKSGLEKGHDLQLAQNRVGIRGYGALIKGTVLPFDQRKENKSFLNLQQYGWRKWLDFFKKSMQHDDQRISLFAKFYIYNKMRSSIYTRGRLTIIYFV